MSVTAPDPGGSFADLEVTSLAARPDLVGAMWDAGPDIWPAFMMEDPVANLYYGRLESDFADTCLLILHDGLLVARAYFIPFVADQEASWGDLPDRGWDAIVERGVADHDAGRTPTAASALEIGIVPAWRGRGLSSFVLGAMRAAVASRGLSDLVAPVRPSGKAARPHEPMAEYVGRTTSEGLPADPWLRVHVRAGGGVVRVAPTSMRIEASIDKWEAWTGRAFDRDGPVVVDGALVPVVVDREADRVVYVEPNVWVHHDLRDVVGVG